MNTANETTRRDDGSILPLVLVMSIIMGLILIPTFAYASAVLRANRVVSDGGREMEAVRAGARVAMADPFEVFARCKPGSSYTLSTNINAPAFTTCTQVDEIGLIPTAEKHRGTVAIQLDETTPNNALDPETSPTGALTDWWVANSTAQPTVGKIWTPALPPKPNVISDPDGYQLGAPYNCTVYFPGMFDQPVVIDDRTYFASGVYYFLDTVTVVGGADAVVGMGVMEGCTDDYDVASLIEPLEPLPSGGGGTFVFGDEGRLIIDDSLATDATGNIVPNTTDKALTFRFNQRYVQESWQPEARVSVMSVNGDIDGNPGPPAAPDALDVPDVIYMPLSDVATSTGLESAIDRGYLPSTLTAEPRPPKPPTGLTAVAYRANGYPVGQRAVFDISWDQPDAASEGGSTITEYVVAIEPGGHTCVTDGATRCVVSGLAGNTNYTFSITAENSAGVSAPSPVVNKVSPDGSPQTYTPQEPENVEFDQYDDAAEIRWDPPVDDGGLPITGYEVTAYRAYKVLPIDPIELREDIATCTTQGYRDDPPPTKCVINLSDLPTQDALLNFNVGWRFEVRAINALGQGAVSDPTADDTLVLDGTAAPGPDPVVIPVAATYVPDPIVDIDTSGPAPADVEFAGYISVPQGRVAVTRSSDPVLLRGGVLAGSYGVADDVATEPDTTIGFENTTLQRKIQLVTTAGGARSVMTVQINENGEYAVNSWVVS